MTMNLLTLFVQGLGMSRFLKQLEKSGSFYVCSIIMTVLAFGCATAPSLPVQSINPIKTSGTTYVIGKTETVSTGSAMLTVYDKYVVPVYKPRYLFQPPNAGIWSMGPITPEQTWIVKYSVENNYLIFSSSHRADIGIEITPNGEIGNEKAWVTYSSGSEMSRRIGARRMIQSEWKLPEPHLFVPSMTDSPPQKDSFKAELIYSRVMNGIISISYREYVDNFARPAFYQEVKYDLKESNDITFRSLKLRVIEANNNQITFQVLDDGGLPWIK